MKLDFLLQAFTTYILVLSWFGIFSLGSVFGFPWRFPFGFGSISVLSVRLHLTHYPSGLSPAYFHFPVIRAVPFIFRGALPKIAARRAACRAPEWSEAKRQRHWGGCGRGVPSHRKGLRASPRKILALIMP